MASYSSSSKFQQSSSISGGSRSVTRNETYSMSSGSKQQSSSYSASSASGVARALSPGRSVVRYEIDNSKSAPKLIMVNRTEAAREELKVKSDASASRETSINVNFKSRSRSGAAAGAHLKEGFQKVALNWRTEKTNLTDLNGRLATYIDRVKFLEETNKRLVDELANLRGNWVTETMRVKERFGPDLLLHRKNLEEAELIKSEIEVRLTSIEDRYNDLVKVYEEQQNINIVDLEEIDTLKELIADYESELLLLRKRVTTFDSEKDKDVEESARLNRSIEALRVKLDGETLQHIRAEHIAQTKREEVEFLKVIQAAELKELEALVYKETASESRGFWKNELAQALEEIQSEYDQRIEEVKSDLEIQYEKRVTDSQAAQAKETVVEASQELQASKSESASLKAKVKDLELQLPDLQEKHRRLVLRITELKRVTEELYRAHDSEKSVYIRQITESETELETILKELKTLLDAKLSLDLQIAAYRKLIEGEEARVQRSTEQAEIVSRSAVVVQRQQEVVQVKKEEGSSASGSAGLKTSFKEVAKGVVAIKESQTAGGFIRLEYKSKTSTAREDISGWKLVRTVDGNPNSVSFTFPSGIGLEHSGASSVLTVWAKGKKPAGDSGFEIEASSWGVGFVVHTILYNAAGEERARYEQTTSLS